MEMPNAAWWKNELKFPVLSKGHAPSRALWSMLFSVDAANTAMPGVFEFGSSIQTDGHGVRVLYEAHRLEPYGGKYKSNDAPSGKLQALHRGIEQSAGANYISSSTDMNGVKRLVAIDPNMEDLMFGVSVLLEKLRVPAGDDVWQPDKVEEYINRVNALKTRRKLQDNSDVTYFRNTFADLKASRW
jgi:hypothetical protein